MDSFQGVGEVVKAGKLVLVMLDEITLGFRESGVGWEFDVFDESGLVGEL